MATEGRQIFMTTSPTRWQRFKWSFRIFMLIIVLAIVVTGIAVMNEYNPSIPQLKNNKAQYASIMKPGKNAAINNIEQKYSDFNKYIGSRQIDLKNIRYVKKSDTIHQIAAPLRAAFYDASDEQSYFSLKNNINKINMLLPLWMTIDTAGDSMVVNSYIRGREIITASKIKVLPVVSNFAGDDFTGAPLHRILADGHKRKKFIDDLLKEVIKNHFAGINIDFEELKESSDESLVSFMRELYTAFHAKNLLVTQDISPFNSDFNLHELNKYNDYIFLMAYDEHNDASEPGAISSQRWIEAAMDEALKSMDTAKLVLGMAAYGYDWLKNGRGVDVNYAEALSIAKESDEKLQFDGTSSNLYYTYEDSLTDGVAQHTVWFTDAATNFNTMRYASGYGIAGVALWRLGSEDSRIWNFYDKDLSDAAADSFKFSSLERINASYDVNYLGEGEVLDVITSPQAGQVELSLDTGNKLISNEVYDSLPSIFVIRKYGKQSKKLVLSFDDGPDDRYTPHILDILDHEHVPAVFFLIGENALNNIKLVKRMYNTGYEIGNHTFTHPNIANIPLSRALIELNSTRLIIESITGHSTVLFRAPYNADSEPETFEELEPVAFAKKNNYLTIGESIDPNDWEKGVPADTIYSRVLQQQDLGSIILLHDAGGNREATIKALPRIIHYFKDKGYTFTTVADLLNEQKENLMPAVPRNQAYYLIQFSYFMAEFSSWGGKALMYLFITCIALSLLRILIMGILAAIEQKKENGRTEHTGNNFPFVSIIVPAYNEEVNAVASLNNLLKSAYPAFEIIFVDDGSKDQTYRKVADAFMNNNKVRVLTKPNGGKASALNFGIAQSAADFVICIDADTQLQPDALGYLMRHFEDAQTGAVAGNVKVGNEVNMLTRWQSIEYTTSQNFDRKAFALINAITVVPGAIGAFRKKAMLEAGGFTTDTLAEDCDLTMRMLRAGYRVVNENKAIAMTEAPETRKQFMKQRFRWSFGVMQAFWKNRDVLFKNGSGALGWIALPNILLFQVMIPLIAPIADLYMIIGIFTGNGLMILAYYGAFMVVDLAVSIMAFGFEHENLGKLIWFVPQRLVYRWLMLHILIKSLRKALQGQLQSWGVLKRTGNVKVVAG